MTLTPKNVTEIAVKTESEIDLDSIQPGRVEALPAGTWHVEFRCFSCGAHNNHIPTADLAGKMVASHLNEYPDHDAKVWLCMEPIEIPIDRRVKP